MQNENIVTPWTAAKTVMCANQHRYVSRNDLFFNDYLVFVNQSWYQFTITVDNKSKSGRHV